jgi:outer membrane lipoprotein SlyB
MRKQAALLALGAMITVGTVVPEPVFAQTQERVYQGRTHHHYRYRCKRSSGTTGLVAGAVGGGLIGHALGGGTVGTLVGAGGGALLGRHLDKKHDAAQNRRNGC